MARGIDTSRLQLFPLENYTVHVTDGDSLLLIGGGKKVSVRMAGMDTPEVPKAGERGLLTGLGQSGNTLGTRYLQKVVNDHRHELQLWIDPSSRSHGRVVGYLTVGNRNINLELVELGLARAITNPQSSTYTAAMDVKMFKAAQDSAVADRKGIFRSPFHRALAAQTADVGGLSYVRMTKSDLVDSSWQRRVRARQVVDEYLASTRAGMAMGDHRQSTYGGFVGMGTGRPDFGASRTFGNPQSMRVIQEMYEKLGFKGGGLFGMDIETTGLDPRDVTTFAGLMDLSTGKAPEAFETFINPKLPLPPKGYSALQTALGEGDFKIRQKAIQAAAYSSGQMTAHLPQWREGGWQAGRQLDADWVVERLESSKMRESLKGPQLKAIKGAKGIDPEDFMRGLFKRIEGMEGRHGWLFIHNAMFESYRLGAAIPEDMWREAITTGRIAAGSPERRFLFNPFDRELHNLRQSALTATQAGKMGEAAQGYSDWLDMFADTFLGRRETATGLKVVDTQDIARGLFAKAHLAGHYKRGGVFTTHGILSQDVLTTLLGMGGEVHMPTPDIEQNLEMVARMLKFQQEMVSGAPSEAALQFFKKAEAIQPDMQLFSMYQDMINQLRGIKEGADPLKHPISIRGDITMKKPSGDYYLSGQKVIDDAIPIHAMAPSIEYPAYIEGQTTAVEYATKRLRDAGITEITPEELVQSAFEARGTVGEISSGQMADMIQTKEYQGLRQIMSRPEAVVSGAALKSLDPTPSKSSKEVGKSGIPGSKQVQAWWDSLQPGTRKGIKGFGVVAGIVGVLGAVRGMTESRRDAQPMTMGSMEEYMARRQQGVHANHDDTQLSMSMASFRMVPDRYPTKV